MSAAGEISGLKKAWKRFYHRRGEGIHSPFVFSLVREVFMLRLPLEEELQAVARHCGCGSVQRIDSAQEVQEAGILYIFAAQPGPGALERLEQIGGAAVFPASQPGNQPANQPGSQARRQPCVKAAGLPGTERAVVVVRKRYTLLVFGRGLTPQTFYL